jgi:hypothetical protein
LLFALAASLVAGMIFGLAPALHAGRVDLIPMLKQEARGSTGSGEQARTRRVLMVTEFALSLVLMIAAGLLLRSFWAPVPPGFIARHGSESALAFLIAVATRPVSRAVCGGDPTWQTFSRADFALYDSAKAHRCCDHLAVAPASGEIDARPEL